MKTSTLMTLSAAMFALSTSAVAQNLSLEAAPTLESFDKGNDIALKSTKLPFEKQIPNAEPLVSEHVSKHVELSADDSSPSRAPQIDDSEQWGDWTDIGTGTYSRGNKKYLFHGSDHSFAVSLQMRNSTVAGHENLHQIKVVGAFGDNDLIFWWDDSDQLTQHDLSAEDIQATYNIDGYTCDFNSIKVDNITYSPAWGKFRFSVHYISDVDGQELSLWYSESIVMDNAPSYSISIAPTKAVYANGETTAQFNISASDNLRAIRYYVMEDIDAEFSGETPTLDESEFIKKDYDIVDASHPTLDVDIVGYQRNFVYFQVLNTDGVPVYYLSQEVVSTQEDNLEWTSLGYGTMIDQDLQEYYLEDPVDPYEWKVEVQQCTATPSIYRLVNPYTNEYSPFRDLEFSEDYTNSYHSYCDLSQNYYIYFRIGNDNNPTEGTDVYSYVFPSGLYFKDVDTGALSYLYAQKFYTCSEDHKISSSYASFELPSFIDYSFELKNNGSNVITIDPAIIGISFKYAIYNSANEDVVSLTDVPDDLVLDLNSQQLNSTEEYRLVVTSFNRDGEARVTKETYFNLGMTDWEYIGTGTYTYTAYYDTTCPHDLYRRKDVNDENHVQYKIDMWMFKATTHFIIDVRDITAVDDQGRVAIDVPIVSTKIINPDYGEIRAADAYSYSGNDQFLNMSYYVPALGEFYMYNVYFVDDGYFDLKYEEFKLDGFPGLTLQDGGQTRANSGYCQSFYVDMANVSYVTYGIYSANEYDSAAAIAALEKDTSATCITAPTTLRFEQVGEYILALVAYNEAGNVVKTATGTFYNVSLLNLDNWTYIGQGFIYDGWILPGYTSESNLDYGWYVDAYSSNANPYVIGFLNPYIDSRCTLTELNKNHVVESMLTVDLSDTDFVIISPQYSGFKSEDYGDISIGNYEGAFIEEYSEKDYIRKLMSAYELKMTTYDPTDNSITIPHCILGYTGSDFGYKWASPQVGYIFLPDNYVLDVHDVIADAHQDNAPVEYFNLQGVRIANPEHGIFICRQGSNVTKVIR